MIIQDRLAAFDGWLTGRIEEAHASRKDLAFRDLIEDEAPAGALWEYSLLDPGARSPAGEGWSVYRLNGVWPETLDEREGAAAPGRRRRSLLEIIAGAVRGRGRG